MQTTGLLRTTRWAVLGVAAVVLSATLALAQSVPVVTGDARVDKLLSVLRALEAQTLDKSRFEVVVVDDGSSDGTAGKCREPFPRMPLPVVRLTTVRR